MEQGREEIPKVFEFRKCYPSPAREGGLDYAQRRSRCPSQKSARSRLTAGGFLHSGKASPCAAWTPSRPPPSTGRLPRVAAPPSAAQRPCRALYPTLSGPPSFERRFGSNG